MLQKHLFKVCFDGNDLLERIHEFKLNEFEYDYARQCTIIQNFNKINDFYEYCINLQKTNFAKLEKFVRRDLQEKYEIGFFRIEKGLNFDEKYICFSDESLDIWSELDVIGLEFMVCFSRAIDGEINGFGMRILDQDRVFNAFKWLFPMGQKCTFGLNKINKSNEIILVEGFTDYIAAKESGYDNVIGLGSIDLTPGHYKFLPPDKKYRFCYDQDRYGYEKRKDRNECFFIPMNFKDPYEAFLNTGKVDFITVAEY